MNSEFDEFKDAIDNVEDQNRIFAPYLFKDELFESKSILDSNARVLKNTIRTM